MAGDNIATNTMPRARNITKQQFGRIVALHPTYKRSGNGSIVWNCKCDCGNLVAVALDSLVGGNTKSCGCLVNDTSRRIGQKNAKDYAGWRFGRLTAQRTIGTNRHGVTWKCRCDCGKYTNVYVANLINGSTKSCGCLRSELITQRGFNYRAAQGFGNGAVNQRERYTSEYKEWRWKVFERDCFTCRACGQVGRRLAAHHVKDFSTNASLRLCVANGKTLCEECHCTFHNKYGNHCSVNEYLEFVGEHT